MENNMKPTGKTLRELFSGVSFDDIVPFILADPHASMGPAQYKQAFDILLHTDGYEEGDWAVEVHRQSDSARRLDAYHLEGNPWELFIDSDIYLEEGPEVSDAEIAYALLWHLTFYGFDPESKKDTFHDMFSSDYCGTRYGLQAFQMEVRRDWVLGDRKIRKEIMDSVCENEKEGYREYSLGEAEWNYIHRHRRHCNGPKRKRDARMARRIDELVRMDRCEHTIARLLEGQTGSSVSRKDLSFLTRTDSRWGCEFKSRAYDTDGRVQYLIELIEKYNAIPIDANVGRIAIRVASSQHHPITRRELEHLMDVIRSAAGKTESALSIAQDDSLDKEISVLIVGEIVGTSGRRM